MPLTPRDARILAKKKELAGVIAAPRPSLARENILELPATPLPSSDWRIEGTLGGYIIVPKRKFDEYQDGDSDDDEDADD